MATYKLNRTKAETWNIASSGHTWILGEKGRIASDTIADGIFAADTITKATIRIDGEIDVGANGADGLDIRSDHAGIKVSETGRITADWSAVSYANFDGAVTISNDGLFEASYAIIVDAKQDSAIIRNAGQIHSAVQGIHLNGAGANIINSGVIKGGEIGIYAAFGSSDANPTAAGNATHVTNSGKITGTYASINASGVAVNLRNTGTLNGDVRLGGGHDVANNNGGTIHGDVWLGSNDDRFDGRGGRLNGVLYGGNGNDIVTLASPATLYVELAGDGIDTVWINATYRLGANIEVLRLLGKANHAGIGNSLDNTIAGNRGDNALYGLDGFDTLDGGKGRDRLDGGGGGDYLHGSKGNDLLTGGDGGDRFQFFKGDGRDTITDFTPGSDLIGIAGFDGIDDVGDLDIDQSGADAVIRFNDTDILVLCDTIGANLADSDFVFSFL